MGEEGREAVTRSQGAGVRVTAQAPTPTSDNEEQSPLAMAS